MISETAAVIMVFLGVMNIRLTTLPWNQCSIIPMQIRQIGYLPG